MATYTYELKDLLEEFKENGQTDAEFCGLTDYPIFDDDFRENLNTRIIENFFTREIGMESIPMWQFAMRRKMWLIMPMYNELFESQQIQFDPMKTVSLSTVANATASATTTTNETNNGNTSNEAQALNVKTDSSFPQNQMGQFGNYARAASEGESVSSTTGSAEETREGEGSSEQESSNNVTVSGYQGLTSNMLIAYRATIINVVQMILEELDECFMQVFNNSDETLPPRINGTGIY